MVRSRYPSTTSVPRAHPVLGAFAQPLAREFLQLRSDSNSDIAMPVHMPLACASVSQKPRQRILLTAS
jgi:hypothetical protein